MDLSFSVQALGCHHLASNDLTPGVHQFPAELDRAIATAKLASRGITIDHLTEDQTDTLSEILDADTFHSWGNDTEGAGS